MDALWESIGLTSGEVTQLVVLIVVLVVGLFLLRVAFKLTATLFRLGCFIILFIAAAVFAFRLLT